LSRPTEFLLRPTQSGRCSQAGRRRLT
jgi:hypothetical protein